MSSPTTNFGWLKPTVGGDTDVWGDELNSNLTSQDSLMRRAINTFISSSAPAEAQAGTQWIDNTTNPYTWKTYDGTDWIVIGYFNTSTNTFSVASTSNYIGDMKFSVQTTSHGSWLLCNGASVSTTTYSGLYAIIGYAFGGSGANFNLPDLRGQVAGAIGSGSYSGASTRTLGQFVGVESTTSVPAHTHFVASDVAIGTDTGSVGSTSYVPRQVTIGGDNAYNMLASLTPATVGLSSSTGSASVSIMQPTLFVGNYFIFSGV